MYLYKDCLFFNQFWWTVFLYVPYKILLKITGIILDCIHLHNLIVMYKMFNISGINIHIKGKGKSHWEKDDGSDTIDYRAYEYYIQETIKLYGGLI